MNCVTCERPRRLGHDPDCPALIDPERWAAAQRVFDLIPAKQAEIWVRDTLQAMVNLAKVRGSQEWGRALITSAGILDGLRDGIAEILGCDRLAVQGEMATRSTAILELNPRFWASVEITEPVRFRVEVEL